MNQENKINGFIESIDAALADVSISEQTRNDLLDLKGQLLIILTASL